MSSEVYSRGFNPLQCFVATSYFGWAPARDQTGVSSDRERLTPWGNSSMKRMMYLIVWQVIQMKDSE